MTRRPLVLQLINKHQEQSLVAATPESSAPAEMPPSNDPHANVDEWGEFLHLPGKKFYDFNEIREEIVRDTELKCGKNTGLHLFSFKNSKID